MKTLHTAYRVVDLARSVDFYTRFGFRELGRVEPGDGRTLVMLRLPDDDRVTLELVEDPRTPFDFGNAFSHLVVQVDDLEATRAALEAHGIKSSETQVHGDPNSEDVTRTSFVDDPDGYRIELVQWPPNHPDGLTDADFET